MRHQNRFQDNEQYLSQMADIFLVRCPRCMGRARVRSSETSPDRVGRVACEQCGFEQSQGLNMASWRGPVRVPASQRCHYCGRWLRRSWRRDDAPREREIVLPCPNCERTTRVPLKWEPISWGDPYDWFFGLPLWLQSPCCGEVLWAYNEHHLQFLKDYVGATLRERQPNRNGSLASRLPKWIKRAANRGEILRCIEHLERLLQQKR